MAFYGFHTVKRPRGTRINPESKVRKAIEYFSAHPDRSMSSVAKKFGTNTTAMNAVINKDKMPVNRLRCPICGRLVKTRNERVMVMNFGEWAKQFNPTE